MPTHSGVFNPVPRTFRERYRYPMPERNACRATAHRRSSFNMVVAELVAES
jgi:hypothetical protein